MKLKDFLTLRIGSGILLSANNTYNPLINYDWSTTTTSGLRYLKDVGSTPTYNASMYFGRGAYLNGVDQTITVPINTTIQTALKRVNGVVTISETSQTLTNYVISGLGVHKDYYLFTRLLTTAEKDSYTNTPELFYAMAQADSTCVLNMPMCETDRYARNMKSYSEGDNFSGVTIGSQTVGEGNSITQNNNTFNITNVVSTGQVYYPLVKFNPYVFNYDLYYQEIEVKCVTGTLKVGALEGSPTTSINEVLTAGQSRVYTKISGFDNLDGNKGAICLDGLNYPIFTATITLRNIRKITAGIYSITNYTASVRNNAKNLQYGLQTCKFVRNSLGVIQSASSYLECDGVGYIKTQWVPTGTDVFTLETVITPALVSKLQAHGNYGTSINEVQIGVTASNLVFASSLNSETVYLPYTENMHVCIVSDGVQSYYYCNNVLIKTTYNNSGSTINPFAFGGVNSGTIFNPTYDTLRLFKIHAIAYTSSQVDAAYYALAKKNTIAYDVIPDECLYDENGNVYIDESGNYIGVDGYVMDESGEYYIV